VKVSREMFRTVRWLLGGLLVLQLIIVPWSHYNLFSWEQQFDGYAPIFAKSYPTATVNVGLLVGQLAVTGGFALALAESSQARGVDRTHPSQGESRS